MQGPCWVSVYVRARAVSTFKLRTVVNTTVGSRSDSGEVKKGEGVLLRYEVTNILTNSVSFGLDCTAMDCPNLNGSLQVSRLYTDGSHGYSSNNEIGKVKYQTTITGKPSEMLGLYYIYLSYDTGKKSHVSFKLAIQEDVY